MILVLALMILITYLWERQSGGVAPQTHEPVNDPNQQTVATFVDAGTSLANRAAGMLPAHIAPETLGTSQSATAGPALQNAIQQVVGLATSNGLSHATDGLLAFTMVTLLFSALATVGIVVPSRGLDPVLGDHHSSATSLTGNWTLFESNVKTTCDPADFCSLLSRTSDTSSSTVVIQQSGTHLIMATPGASQTGGIDLDTLTGTVIGNTIDLSTSYHGRYSSRGATVDLSVSFHLTGTVNSINRLSGKISFNATETGSSEGQGFVKTENGTEDVVVTRITP